MSFTNAQLAQKISDLIDYWSSFNTEYSDWLGGTVDGGPGADGKYPLTNWAGAESLIDSPAKLADNVSGYVGLASASETAAAASAAAAATSESNASTSASTATAQAVLADADRVAAELAESNALSSQTVSTAQANLATDRAGYAAEWANKAEDSLVSAAAGGDLVDDYSAMHHATKGAVSAAAALASEIAAAASAAAAATFDPALFAALADNEIVTGTWSFTSQDTRFGNATPYVARALSVADTGIVVAELSRNANTGMIVDMNLNSATAATNAFGFRFQQQASLKGFVGAYPSTYGGVVGIGLTYSTAPYVTFHTPASGGMRYWNAAGSGYAQFNYDDPNFSIDKPLDVTGAVAATGAVTGSNLNVANWDTAYGWGDHASAGYATISSGTFDGAVTAGNDSNTRGEVLIYSDNLTDPVNDDGLSPGRLWMEGRGAYNDWNIQPYQNNLYFWKSSSVVTSPVMALTTGGVLTTLDGGSSTNWNTAYGWGDHAGLYSLAAHNHAGVYEPADATILKDADIGVTVAAFSHSHSDYLSNTGVAVHSGDIDFSNILGDRITLWGTHDNAASYALGIESGTMYFKADAQYRWYFDVNADLGVSDTMELTPNALYVNTQILAGNGYGSAGTPSFTSTQDANSGMYVKSSDTLGFSTGGVERVTIDVNGLTIVAAGADLILGNNSLTAENISSSAGAAPLKIGTGTGTPMVWGQYCALGRTYSAARTGLANNAYVDTDDAVSGQWRHLVTHGSYGHTILEMAAGAYYFYGKSESVTSGNIVTKNQYAQLDDGNGFKVATTANGNPGAGWSSLSRDMLHIDGKEVIDGNDTWLRINMNGDFTSGTYLPTAWHFANVMKRYNKGAYIYHHGTGYAASGAGGITFSTSAASGGVSGDIWFQYT